MGFTADAIVAGFRNWIVARGRGLFDVAFIGIGQIIAAVLIAMVAAFLELSRFHAFSALESDANSDVPGPLISELPTQLSLGSVQ
jgi:hypothetical protein